MDNFDLKIQQEMLNRDVSKETYENFYLRVFNKKRSGDNARKAMYGIIDLLNLKSEFENEVDELEYNIDKKISDDRLKYKETTEISDGGILKSDKLIEISDEELRNPSALLRKHGFNEKNWELTSAKNSMWNSYNKNDGIITLYSSKISVKPITPAFDVVDIQKTIDGIDFGNIKLPNIDNYSKDGKTIEINFADVHLGKFVNETISDGVYNIDIAMKRYENAIDDAINRIRVFNIKEILFIVGQDFMNVDNLESSTNKLTRQDSNMFYSEMYEKSYSVLLQTVEKLRKLAPVKVIYVKGNHDTLTTYTMVHSLKKLYDFHNISSVEVDDTMKQRKYYSFGDVLIGFSHGDKEGKRIFEVMQTDQKDNWSKKYKYFHLSHIHHEVKVERGGVIYQWLSSMSENCKWTYESGFVGSEKKGHVFVYDDKNGLEGEMFIKS